MAQTPEEAKKNADFLESCIWALIDARDDTQLATLLQKVMSATNSLSLFLPEMCSHCKPFGDHSFSIVSHSPSPRCCTVSYLSWDQTSTVPRHSRSSRRSAAGSRTALLSSPLQSYSRCCFPLSVCDCFAILVVPSPCRSREAEGREVHGRDLAN